MYRVYVTDSKGNHLVVIKSTKSWQHVRTNLWRWKRNNLDRIYDMGENPSTLLVDGIPFYEVLRKLIRM